MFEVTISTTKSKSKDISFILNRLRSQIKALRGIIVCEEFDNRSKLGIAVYEDKKDLAISYIFDAVCEAIIRSYKEDYLLSKIKIHSVDKVILSAFIKSLVFFDKTTDKELIKKSLKVSGEILIDSFYNFRLWELEKRWDDLASLVSENSGYLLMNGAFMELMKFLLLTNEVEISEVHLHEKDNSLLFFSKEGRELFCFDNKSRDDDYKINVISELIGLSPEKIIVHEDVKDKDLSDYLISLFDSKVSLIK